MPNWLLKENADLLAPTITDILNSSFAERRLPPSWKPVDIVPIPKQKPIKDVNKHLHPISLTSVKSKVAEEFVIEEHLKPAILKKIGDNQYGAIPNSSTTQAVISMVHSWTKYTDRTGSTVIVVLFDYRKAFDLTDHTLLVRKLLTLDIPYGITGGITCWVIDFLKNLLHNLCQTSGGVYLPSFSQCAPGIPVSRTGETSETRNAHYFSFYAL